MASRLELCNVKGIGGRSFALRSVFWPVALRGALDGDVPQWEQVAANPNTNPHPDPDPNPFPNPTTNPTPGGGGGGRHLAELVAACHDGLLTLLQVSQLAS